MELLACVVATSHLLLRSGQIIGYISQGSHLFASAHSVPVSTRDASPRGPAGSPSPRTTTRQSSVEVKMETVIPTIENRLKTFDETNGIFVFTQERDSELT